MVHHKTNPRSIHFAIMVSVWILKPIVAAKRYSWEGAPFLGRLVMLRLASRSALRGASKWLEERGPHFFDHQGQVKCSNTVSVKCREASLMQRPQSALKTA